MSTKVSGTLLEIYLQDYFSLKQSGNSTNNIEEKIMFLLDGFNAEYDASQALLLTHTYEFEQGEKFLLEKLQCTELLLRINIIPNIIINGFQLIWIFGSISILTSTLNILQDKLSYSSLSESHRKFASQWSIIISKIEEVVALPPSSRRDCKTFLRYIKADINQVTIDGNNLIPKHIRNLCYEKFKNVPNFEMPEIVGVVSHTRSFFSKDSVSINIRRESSSIPLLN
jgi:hypothetical protein